MPDESVSANLFRELERVIERLVVKGWLHGVGRAKARVDQGPRHGATSASILKATVSFDVHIKFSLDTAQRELHGYSVLKGCEGYGGHLLPPLFSDLLQEQAGGSALMLAPYETDAPTVADLLVEPRDDAADVVLFYRDFLQASQRVWLATHRSDEPLTREQLREMYWQKTLDRTPALAEAIGVGGRQELVRLRLEINGTDYGTIGDLFATFLRKLDALGDVYPCATHGDENATNVLVEADALGLAHTEGWRLVDYVSSGDRNDWIYSIGKMLMDWECDQVLRAARLLPDPAVFLGASWAVEGDVLRLAYSESSLQSIMPPVCVELASAVREVAEATASQVGESPDWRQRLKLATFAICMGSSALRFGREPQILPVMWGHAVRSLVE